MRELENGVNANNTKQSTLPKFQTLAKCVPQKRCVGAVRRIRKKTERFGRGEGGFLVKKGCKEGGGSL